MTTPGSQPEAGWHLNANGQQQWWDGSSWGPVAKGQPAATTPLVPRIVVLAPMKRRTTAFWLAILLGTLGAHRFYLRRPVTASILLVLAIVGVGFRLDPDPMSHLISYGILAYQVIWVLSDLFIIPRVVDQVNAETARSAQLH